MSIMFELVTPRTVRTPDTSATCTTRRTVVPARPDAGFSEPGSALRAATAAAAVSAATAALSAASQCGGATRRKNKKPSTTSLQGPASGW